ncbi:MAG: hypothetical protein K1W20_00315, partial [Lachnospiraceae bacterium]
MKSKNLNKKRRMAAAVFCLALAMGMTGCVKTTEKREAEEENATQESEWEKEEPVTAKEAKPEPDKEEQADNVEKPEPDKQKQAEKDEKPAAAENILDKAKGTEFLGGKVQNPQADGMTLAQTTIVDENGSVTMLDMKDAKRISVKFTPDTKVEHWTIQGGGAGIDMQAAEVSDLEEGMGVEVEGYYEEETFVAVKVIMEAVSYKNL